MAKWYGERTAISPERAEEKSAEIVRTTKRQMPAAPTTVYAKPPEEFNFFTLQENLQNCLSIVDNEVMKGYVPALQQCAVVPVERAELEQLEQIQFFRISELVYEEDEFSVHKLATVFHALSNKPCTLVLMIHSDGQTNDFYLGVRSRDSRYSGGTMRQMLEQSFLGLFPGSSTDHYYNEDMQADLNSICADAVSSVTCIADYKQNKGSVGNKGYIQGLEKFIYSMQGKPFTAVCIANNLSHTDLTEARKEYERIYTLMSPFATMQYNYAQNQSASTSDSHTKGETRTESVGRSQGVNTNETVSDAQTYGTNSAYTTTKTKGNSFSDGYGTSHTVGTTDGINESGTITNTKGKTVGANAGIVIAGVNTSVSSSVSRSRTYGTSHTNSISDSISRNLTYGINSSEAVGNTSGQNESTTSTLSRGKGTQYSENTGHSMAENYAQTKALTDTFGSSQAVTLNVQNKSLINTLKRLEKQLERLDECESVGLWDFAAYFLGESAAETEAAASMYRSLVSGSQSGLELAAVNTWTDEERVTEISKYVKNFLHPVFRYQAENGPIRRETLVDASALASTNELAIQLGIPRKSVKGLPVVEHAAFGQEVLHKDISEDRQIIKLGKINHLGKEKECMVGLDTQSLSMHTFITGSTGSGKTTAIYTLLDKLIHMPVKQQQKNITFMVIEPAKGEYKNRFGQYDNVKVYGTNRKKTPLLRIDPFSFPEDVHVLEHIDRLIEIFNVCWPMYAAMPAVLKDAVEQAYRFAGWNLDTSECRYTDAAGIPLYPSFTDVLYHVNAVMNASQYSDESKGDYKGALCTRLKSLTNGLYRQIFTSDEIPAAELFDENVIVDLSRTGSSETKALIMGLLVMKLQEYRMSEQSIGNQPLKHVTVLEEAHHILKRTAVQQSEESSNLLGKSVEMLANSIAEMRTYGEGFVIADQSPGLLDISVIRNTNTKIIMRLPDHADRELAGRAAGLNDEQIAEIAKLGKGVAAVYQNDWIEPVLCHIQADLKESIPYYVTPSAQDTQKSKEILIHSLLAPHSWLEELDDRFVDGLIRECFRLPISSKAKIAFLNHIRAEKTSNIEYTKGMILDEMLNAQASFDGMRPYESDMPMWYEQMTEELGLHSMDFDETACKQILALLTKYRAECDDSPRAALLFNDLMRFL